MKQLLFILLSTLCFKVSLAQSIERQVISSTGNYLNTGTIQASSTAGEIIIPTFSQGTWVITQGFQQPDITHIVGIVELNRGTGDLFNLYPNPNNGNFEIQFSDLYNTELQIFNSIGQKIFTQPINDKKSLAISLTDLSEGIYFIQVYAKGKVQTKKFVLTK